MKIGGRNAQTRFFRGRVRAWLFASLMITAVSSLSLAAYFQSFEFDDFDWFGATRVPTLTHGVPSKTGTWHAEDQNFSGTTFTRWSGYSKTFPPGGYTTTIDIYLDTLPPYMNTVGYSNDTRFDWSSAINTPNCAHRRDFVFNAGFYTNMTAPAPHFVISASNNAGRGSSFPNNPGRMPITIFDEGWFTFEHRFRDQAGVLAVDLTIRDSLGIVRGAWTLSDPTDIINVNVGGNRYGWFVTNEFPFLSFDNSILVGFQDYCVTPPSTPGAKVTGGGWITVAGGEGSFGLTAKADSAGNPSGNLTYQDHPQNRTVKSTAITSVMISGNCAQIFGRARVNGTGDFGFQVGVCDIDEPGKDTDTFTITMSDGYTAGGTLQGGNIQIH
jgi:hypothetical protein